MGYPVVPGGGARVGGPAGYTYGIVATQGAGEDVLSALREARFSGWLAPPEAGWVVAVAASGAGTVASDRRGVVGVGEWLATRVDGTVLAIRVVADRQLLLAVWSNREEIGRYVSNPSYGQDDDTLPDPLGVEHAAAFAAACGNPDAGDDLADLLAEELDPDSIIESERLGGVLGLLGLPSWLVAVPSLPGDVPTGPPAAELTRLGAGATGFRGRVRGRAAEVLRRRRPPPPAFTDAPRGGGVDPWLF